MKSAGRPHFWSPGGVCALMGRRVFDPEGLVWKPLGYLGDLVVLSLLWALCSIGVVTAGAAGAALYDAAVHALRRKDSQLIGRFFDTFKRELKSGVLATLFWPGVLPGLVALVCTWLIEPVFRRCEEAEREETPAE